MKLTIVISCFKAMITYMFGSVASDYTMFTDHNKYIVK